MELEERNRKQSVYKQFRSSLDIGMGVMYVTISLYALKIPGIMENYGSTLVRVFVALFVFYGAFRILRGGISLRKNYLERK